MLLMKAVDAGRSSMLTEEQELLILKDLDDDNKDSRSPVRSPRRREKEDGDERRQCSRRRAQAVAAWRKELGKESMSDEEEMAILAGLSVTVSEQGSADKCRSGLTA